MSLEEEINKSCGHVKNAGKKKSKVYQKSYGLGHVMMNLETIYVKKNKKKLAIRMTNFLDSIQKESCE